MDFDQAGGEWGPLRRCLVTTAVRAYSLYDGAGRDWTAMRAAGGDIH
jgi:hypothetical protein